MKQINTAPIIIGIDPGVSTGIAVWDRNARVFSTITSDGIVGVMKRVLALHKAVGVEVWFEDARLRSWFGAKGREALQGAGSIKRDCQIWEEWCCLYGIKYRSIKPAAGATTGRPLS